jgi:O-antigen/teichoic acid export membrane protein
VLVQQVLIPSSRLICVVLAIALGYQLIGVAWSYVMAEVLGIMYSGYFLFKGFPEIRQKSPSIYEVRKITFFSLPLLFSGMFNRIVARADILIMGHYLSATMVGIYGIARRFLPLIMMPLGAFNSIFAPIISDLFVRKKKEDLEDQFKTIAKWVFMTSLPIFTLLTFFSKQILSIFGPGFVAGSLAMMILCIGQMVNAATGSVGFMLMMTGRPFANSLNSGLLCVTNILLNIYLIPRYGIVGAACASAFSITAIQLLRLAEVWYFLRMHPYRWDFLKPVFSGLFAVILATMISHSGMSTAQIFSLPILVTLFLLSYVGFLWLLKLSPEDHLVLNGLRRKLFGQKGQQMEPVACDQGDGSNE